MTMQEIIVHHGGCRRTPKNVDAIQIQNVIAELETRLAQSKQYQQGLVASLESWKKTYSALSRTPCKSSVCSLPAATVANSPMEVDNDMSHLLNAMAIDSATKVGNQPCRTVVAVKAHPNGMWNDKLVQQPQPHHHYQQQLHVQGLCIQQATGITTQGGQQHDKVISNARSQNENSVQPTLYRTQLKFNLDHYLKISSSKSGGQEENHENSPTSV